MLGAERKELYIYNIHFRIVLEASRGAQSVAVNVTGCGFDPHPKNLNIYLNLYFPFFDLVSGQSAIASRIQRIHMS